MRLLILSLLLLANTARADTTAPIDSRLLEAWRALHPNQSLPATCPHPDPIQVLTADLDPTPGAETAFASYRFGVVLLSAASQPLAALDLGCADTRYGTPAITSLSSIRASGLAPSDLSLTSRSLGHCGTFVERTLYHRDARKLTEILRFDEQIDRFCGDSPWQQYHLSNLDIRGPGHLLVEWEGTIRKHLPATGDYGPPERFHGHSFYTLRDGKFSDR